MTEKLGRIDVQKDTMLFITNFLLSQNIKETTTKENILKMLPKIYENADDEMLLKILPYDSYLILEELIKYVKKNKIENNEITNKVYELFDKEIRGISYLQDAMIIVLRATKDSHKYYIDKNVLNVLERLYTSENRKKAERYGKIEKLILGILYTYGIVEKNFFRELICEKMEELIPKEKIVNFCIIRLNLNNIVNYRYVKWQDETTNEFVTYLRDLEDIEYYNPDLEDVLDIAAEQKTRGLDYKKYTREYYFYKSKNELDKADKEFFKYMKSKNNIIFKYKFMEIIKNIKCGIRMEEKILEYLNLDIDKDGQEFIDKYMKWYNDMPQYILCGYSPKEFAIKYYEEN